MSQSPFLDSVERRRPGSSMRAYVTRTLPHSSAIVVANRAPHEPRPEGHLEPLGQVVDPLGGAAAVGAFVFEGHGRKRSRSSFFAPLPGDFEDSRGNPSRSGHFRVVMYLFGTFC